MKKQPKYTRVFQLLAIFSIAMGLMEAIVVVYLRNLYYPLGFSFPLNDLPKQIVILEWVREITTLTMIGCVAILCGQKMIQRIAYFLYSMGIWDVVYYLGLKVILNWPESPNTWDILFLIPVIWIAPVWAPIICSLVMITFAILLEHFRKYQHLQRLYKDEWALLLVGATIIIIAFLWESGSLIVKSYYLENQSPGFSPTSFHKSLLQYVPTRFVWEVYWTGLLMIFFAILKIYKRLNRH